MAAAAIHFVQQATASAECWRAMEWSGGERSDRSPSPLDMLLLELAIQANPCSSGRGRTCKPSQYKALQCDDLELKDLKLKDLQFKDLQFKDL
jgi:hypothetical protein